MRYSASLLALCLLCTLGLLRAASAADFDTLMSCDRSIEQDSPALFAACKRHPLATYRLYSTTKTLPNVADNAAYESESDLVLKEARDTIKKFIVKLNTTVKSVESYFFQWQEPFKLRNAYEILIIEDTTADVPYTNQQFKDACDAIASGAELASAATNKYFRKYVEGMANSDSDASTCAIRVREPLLWVFSLDMITSFERYGVLSNPMAFIANRVGTLKTTIVPPGIAFIFNPAVTSLSSLSGNAAKSLFGSCAGCGYVRMILLFSDGGGTQSLNFRDWWDDKMKADLKKTGVQPVVNPEETTFWEIMKPLLIALVIPKPIRLLAQIFTTIRDLWIKMKMTSRIWRKIILGILKQFSLARATYTIYLDVGLGTTGLSPSTTALKGSFEQGGFKGSAVQFSMRMQLQNIFRSTASARDYCSLVYSSKSPYAGMPSYRLPPKGWGLDIELVATFKIDPFKTGDAASFVIEVAVKYMSGTQFFDLYDKNKANRGGADATLQTKSAGYMYGERLAKCKAFIDGGCGMDAKTCELYKRYPDVWPIHTVGVSRRDVEQDDHPSDSYELRERRRVFRRDLEQEQSRHAVYRRVASSGSTLAFILRLPAITMKNIWCMLINGFDQFNCRTVDVDSPVIYPILALTGLFKFGAAGLYYDQGTKLSSSLGGSLGYLPGPTFSIFYNTQTKVKIVKIEAKLLYGAIPLMLLQSSWQFGRSTATSRRRGDASGAYYEPEMARVRRSGAAFQAVFSWSLGSTTLGKMAGYMGLDLLKPALDVLALADIQVGVGCALAITEVNPMASPHLMPKDGLFDDVPVIPRGISIVAKVTLPPCNGGAVCKFMTNSLGLPSDMSITVIATLGWKSFTLGIALGNVVFTRDRCLEGSLDGLGRPKISLRNLGFYATIAVEFGPDEDGEGGGDSQRRRSMSVGSVTTGFSLSMLINANTMEVTKKDKCAQPNYLQFSGQITTFQSETAQLFSLRVQMIGIWENAFGIPRFYFGNFLFAMTFDMMAGGAPTGFQVGGSLRVGKDCITVSSTTGVAVWNDAANCVGGSLYGGLSLSPSSASTPASSGSSSNYLYISLFGLSIPDLVHMVAGSEASAEKILDGMPSMVASMGFQKQLGAIVNGEQQYKPNPLLSICMNAMGCFVPGLTKPLNFGMRLFGNVTFLGVDAGIDLNVQLGIQPLIMRFNLWLSKRIKFANVFMIGRSCAKDDRRGPYVYSGLKAKALPPALLEFRVNVTGATMFLGTCSSVNLQIAKGYSSLVMTGIPLFWVLNMDVSSNVTYHSLSSASAAATMNVTEGSLLKTVTTLHALLNRASNAFSRKMDQAKEDCGEFFTDIGDGLASAARFIDDGVDKVGAAVSNAANNVKNKAAGFAKKYGPVLVNYGKNVADAIIAGDMAALGRLMKNLGAAVSDAMVSSVQSACSSAYTYKDKCKTCLTSAHAHVDTLTTEVERLIGVLADVNGNYLSAAESALSLISNLVATCGESNIDCQLDQLNLAAEKVTQMTMVQGNFEQRLRALRDVVQSALDTVAATVSGFMSSARRRRAIDIDASYVDLNAIDHHVNVRGLKKWGKKTAKNAKKAGKTVIEATKKVVEEIVIDCDGKLRDEKEVCRVSLVRVLRAKLLQLQTELSHLKMTALGDGTTVAPHVSLEDDIAYARVLVRTAWYKRQGMHGAASPFLYSDKRAREHIRRRVTVTGRRCLPFLFNGLVYEGCTTIGRQFEWCATSVFASTGLVKEWEECKGSQRYARLLVTTAPQSVTSVNLFDDNMRALRPTIDFVYNAAKGWIVVKSSSVPVRAIALNEGNGDFVVAGRVLTPCYPTWRVSMPVVRDDVQQKTRMPVEQGGAVDLAVQRDDTGKVTALRLTILEAETTSTSVFFSSILLLDATSGEVIPVAQVQLSAEPLTCTLAEGCAITSVATFTLKKPVRIHGVRITSVPTRRPARWTIEGRMLESCVWRTMLTAAASNSINPLRGVMTWTTNDFLFSDDFQVGSTLTRYNRIGSAVIAPKTALPLWVASWTGGVTIHAWLHTTAAFSCPLTTTSRLINVAQSQGWPNVAGPIYGRQCLKHYGTVGGFRLGVTCDGRIVLMVRQRHCGAHYAIVRSDLTLVEHQSERYHHISAIIDSRSSLVRFFINGASAGVVDFAYDQTAADVASFLAIHSPRLERVVSVLPFALSVGVLQRIVDHTEPSKVGNVGGVCSTTGTDRVRFCRLGSNCGAVGARWICKQECPYASDGHDANGFCMHKSRERPAGAACTTMGECTSQVCEVPSGQTVGVCGLAAGETGCSTSVPCAGSSYGLSACSQGLCVETCLLATIPVVNGKCKWTGINDVPVGQVCRNTANCVTGCLCTNNVCSVATGRRDSELSRTWSGVVPHQHPTRARRNIVCDAAVGAVELAGSAGLAILRALTKAIMGAFRLRSAVFHADIQPAQLSGVLTVDLDVSVFGTRRRTKWSLNLGSVMRTAINLLRVVGNKVCSGMPSAQQCKDLMDEATAIPDDGELDVLTEEELSAAENEV